MEKIKFAAQVLMIMSVIPVLFIGTILDNDARIRINTSIEHAYTSYATQNRAYVNGRINPRFIMSCGKRTTYVKK
jgi:hypothetical protein